MSNPTTAELCPKCNRRLKSDPANWRFQRLCQCSKPTSAEIRERHKWCSDNYESFMSNPFEGECESALSLVHKDRGILLDRLEAAEAHRQEDLGIKLKLGVRLTKVEATIKAMKLLLKVAKCPDTNCDGKGTVCRTEGVYPNGEVALDLHECQWCSETKAIIKENKGE